jgi:hypothetical protein
MERDDEDGWIFVNKEAPVSDETIQDAIKQTDSNVSKLLFLLNMLSEAKSTNDYATIRNLMPQCQRIIETLRTKYLPILISASHQNYGDSKEVLSKSSQVAISGSLGVTAGASVWALVPQIGVGACLTASTAGTLLCALLLFQVVRAYGDRKRKENENNTESLEKFATLTDVIPTWAQDLTIDNIEEWTLRLSDYLTEEERTRRNSGKIQ